jgi:hypothetical protein
MSFWGYVHCIHYALGSCKTAIVIMQRRLMSICKTSIHRFESGRRLHSRMRYIAERRSTAFVVLVGVSVTVSVNGFIVS